MKLSKIKEFVNISRQVIEDSVQENGAIIAADSGKSVYPSVVQNYRYVWIRDASYTCMAADILGLKYILKTVPDNSLVRYNVSHYEEGACYEYNDDGARACR